MLQLKQITLLLTLLCSRNSLLSCFYKSMRFEVNEILLLEEASNSRGTG